MLLVLLPTSDMDLASITKYFEHGDDVRQKFRHPDRDWSILLLSAIVITTILVVVSVGLYFVSKKTDFFAVTPEVNSSVRIIDVAELNELITEFKENEVRFRALGGRP